MHLRCYDPSPSGCGGSLRRIYPCREPRTAKIARLKFAEIANTEYANYWLQVLDCNSFVCGLQVLAAFSDERTPGFY